MIVYILLVSFRCERAMDVALSTCSPTNPFGAAMAISAVTRSRGDCARQSYKKLNICLPVSSSSLCYYVTHKASSPTHTPALSPSLSLPLSHSLSL